MSPTRNSSTVLQHFENGNVIKICNRIMFNFYMGLPHMLLCHASPLLYVTQRVVEVACALDILW